MGLIQVCFVMIVRLVNNFICRFGGGRGGGFGDFNQGYNQGKGKNVRKASDQL